MMQDAIIPERVKAARAGEEAAWNFLYHHYHPQLYARAQNMMRQPDLAKDALRDVFMNACLKLSQLIELAGFIATYLLSIRIVFSRNDFRITQNAGWKILQKNGAPLFLKPPNR